ncbi:inactive UDP-glycosyltransferase 79A6-like [Cryptomeria japonica]|uniref:inactive UDP-glycosyltransferase 79A6-like n=1 Tax=Cryptomeria japonica TaxID=3369 RepID=UPI0027DA63C4|nr:inactive UDP-glycosyltransferase 79A6-like [Cryptomeria japonica]
MAEEMHRELRVVIFPGLAHGHITPFVELAKGLASHAGINLVELAMPSVQRLPTGIETSAVLLPLLTVAMDLLEKPFEVLLRELSPDFVIYDVMQHWVPRVAIQLPNPIVPILFVPSGVANFSFLEGQLDITSGNLTTEDLTVSPPGFPSLNVHFTLFEGRRAMEMLYQKNAGRLSVAERASICLRESWAVACNTCLELEGGYVEYFQRLVKRPVYPVGILMRHLLPPRIDDICLQWLDRQPAASVVVLGFGSEYILTRQQFVAMAMGLQESNASFLWFLRAGNDLLQRFQDQIRVC